MRVVGRLLSHSMSGWWERTLANTLANVRMCVVITVCGKWRSPPVAEGDPFWWRGWKKEFPRASDWWWSWKRRASLLSLEERAFETQEWLGKERWVFILGLYYRTLVFGVPSNFWRWIRPPHLTLHNSPRRPNRWRGPKREVTRTPRLVPALERGRVMDAIGGRGIKEWGVSRRGGGGS